ncbi:MAG: hypothetical protein ACQESE_00765 [Nanobdellota archaeon]
MGLKLFKKKSSSPDKGDLSADSSSSDNANIDKALNDLPPIDCPPDNSDCKVNAADTASPQGNISSSELQQKKAPSMPQPIDSSSQEETNWTGSSDQPSQPDSPTEHPVPADEQSEQPDDTGSSSLSKEQAALVDNQPVTPSSEDIDKTSSEDPSADQTEKTVDNATTSPKDQSAVVKDDTSVPTSSDSTILGASPSSGDSSSSTALKHDLPDFGSEASDLQELESELSQPVVREQKGSFVKELFVEKRKYQELLFMINDSKTLLSTEVESEKGIESIDKKIGDSLESLNKKYGQLYDKLSSTITKLSSSN